MAKAKFLTAITESQEAKRQAVANLTAADRNVQAHVNRKEQQDHAIARLLIDNFPNEGLYCHGLNHSVCLYPSAFPKTGRIAEVITEMRNKLYLSTEDKELIKELKGIGFEETLSNGRDCFVIDFNNNEVYGSFVQFLFEKEAKRLSSIAVAEIKALYTNQVNLLDGIKNGFEQQLDVPVHALHEQATADFKEAVIGIAAGKSKAKK